MTDDLFISNIKKLGISDKKPNNPELFVLHQNIASLLLRSAKTSNYDSHEERMVCDDMIEPIL